MNIHSQQGKGVLALVILALGSAIIAISARYLSFYFTLLQQLYLSFGVAFICSLFFLGKPFSFAKLKRLPQKDWIVIIMRVVTGKCCHILINNNYTKILERIQELFYFIFQ
jgi:hypothetical protein